jgi:type I restriction enzyme S subunit
MSNKANVDGKVPKLRFPEFRDGPEWKVKPLGESLLRRPDYGVNAPAVPYTDNLPTYLRITDISEDGYFLRDQRTSVDIDAASDNYLHEGDIALARTGASVGKSYKYRPADGELVFAGFLIRIRPNKTKLISDFVSHFLFTSQYWSWVNATSARSGQPGINGNEYAQLPIPTPPSLDEQQKIADCLSSIDDLIAAHTQKLDALKAHKKGLMQQLFPAEGETLPKLRFPEFRDSGEWKETHLGQLAETVSGLTYSPDDTRENGLLVLRSSNIKDGGILLEDCVYVRLDIKGANLSEPNKMQVAADLGARINSINNSKLRRYKFLVPQPPEQQKIADCLSSIDELITAQTQKIESLITHKKGLMQQLFPSADEVHV